MYEIEFYEDNNGESELWDFIEFIRVKSSTSKNYHIQYKQIIFYIELLKNNGTNLSNTIVRRIVEDIYELRPGHNRILFFSFTGNKFVLLHPFRKKTQKTPINEIKKAKQKRDSYIKRSSK